MREADLAGLGGAAATDEGGGGDGVVGGAEGSSVDEGVFSGEQAGDTVQLSSLLS